jgi:hypothetical protein
LERGRTEPVGPVGRRLRRRRRRGEHAEKAAVAKARAGRQDRAIADEAAASDPIDADLKPAAEYAASSRCSPATMG